MQQAQALLTQGSRAVPVPVPPAPAIPANASPGLRAYLAKRSQLMQAELQTYNQYVNADPAAREAAMKQWREANAAEFSQLQAMARNLSAAAGLSLAQCSRMVSMVASDWGCGAGSSDSARPGAAKAAISELGRDQVADAVKSAENPPLV